MFPPCQHSGWGLEVWREEENPLIFTSQLQKELETASL